MRKEHSKAKDTTPKKKKRILLFLIPFFILLVVAIYSYHTFYYRKHHEPPTTQTSTTQEQIYSLKRQRRMLSLTPEVKRAAFNGRATEIDYGTYLIPGLNATETQVYQQKGTSSICTSMTPQGLAVTEDYLIVSAYCYTSTHNSVLYVIDKKTHKFIKEIVLPNKSHVGGLAYDPLHHNIWITCKSRGIPQVNAISMVQLETYSFQKSYKPIKYAQTYDLYAITRSSFLTYYDNSLYVGYFTSNSASVMEEYEITENGTLATRTANIGPSVNDLAPVALPSDIRVITERAQGVAFYQDKLLFSHSYGILPSSLKVYRNSLQKLLENDGVIQEVRFPEKLEQIYVDEDNLYVLFESAASGYRTSSLIRCDRILKLNLDTLLD